MNELLHHPIIVQGVGVIALIFGVWAFSHKDDKKLKLLLTAQSFSLTVHFFLLGANGGFIASGVTTVRNACSLFDNIKKIAPVFIILYLTLGYFRYEVWVDLLPIAASLCGTVGLFYFTGIKLRICTLAGMCFWIVHNAAVFSIGPFFMEVFLLFINLRTMYALHKSKAVQT